MDKNTKPSWMPKVIALVVVLAAGGLVAAMQGKKDLGPVVLPAAGDDTSGSPEDAKSELSATYKDGTYSTEGNYASPGGPETIDVTLTVKDGVITEADVVANATNPGSVMWQGKFVEGYKAEVVGKNLADLELTKVSGSSLTPKGFNNALEEIRAQAVAA